MQIVFVALTVGAAAVPNSAIVAALSSAAEQGNWSTADFPRDGVGETTDRHQFAGVTDSFTECIALTTGISSRLDDGLDPLMRSLSWPNLGTCSQAYPAIQSLSAGSEADQSYVYNRYWIGSAALTRPLLALGGIGAIRLAAGAILLAGFVCAAVALGRRSSWWTPVFLFAPLLLSTNLVTQTLGSYPHVFSIGVALFGVALGVRLGREPAPAIVALSLVAGGTFNFVDFLLNPPLAWSMFVFGVIIGCLGRGRPVVLRSLLLTLASGVAGWMLGYLLTWATRWALAVAAFGRSALDEIISTIFTRLDGQSGDLVIPGFTVSTRRNLSFWLDTIPTAPILAMTFGALIVVALVVLIVRRQWRALLIVLVVAAPAMLIPIWYETLRNHSQIHMWFAYRAVPVGLGIVAAAAWLPLVVAGLRATPKRRPALPPGGGR